MLTVLGYNWFNDLGNSQDYQFVSDTTGGPTFAGSIQLPANSQTELHFLAPSNFSGKDFVWMNFAYQSGPGIYVSAYQLPPYATQLEMIVDNTTGSSQSISVQAAFLMGAQGMTV